MVGQAVDVEQAGAGDMRGGELRRGSRRSAGMNRLAVDDGEVGGAKFARQPVGRDEVVH